MRSVFCWGGGEKIVCVAKRRTTLHNSLSSSEETETTYDWLSPSGRQPLEETLSF